MEGKDIERGEGLAVGTDGLAGPAEEEDWVIEEDRVASRVTVEGDLDEQLAMAVGIVAMGEQ